MRINTVIINVSSHEPNLNDLQMEIHNRYCAHVVATQFEYKTPLAADPEFLASLRSTHATTAMMRETPSQPKPGLPSDNSRAVEQMSEFDRFLKLSITISHFGTNSSE